MPTKLPSMQFYPGDWLKKTRHLSLAGKGGWLDLIVFMWDAPIRGELVDTIEGYARMLGCSEKLASQVIEEISNPLRPVCDREILSDGRIRLRSRRMIREEKTRQTDADRQRRNRSNNNPKSPDGAPSGDGLSRDGHADVTDVSRQRHASVTPLSQHSSSSSSSSSSEKKERKKEAPLGFSRFWDVWPEHHRKSNRDKCLAHWNANELESLAERIIAHVEACRGSEQWAETNGKFIIAPLVYLNQKRWEAPPPPPPQSQDQVDELLNTLTHEADEAEEIAENLRLRGGSKRAS